MTPRGLFSLWSLLGVIAVGEIPGTLQKGEKGNTVMVTSIKGWGRGVLKTEGGGGVHLHKHRFTCSPKS